MKTSRNLFLWLLSLALIGGLVAACAAPPAPPPAAPQPAATEAPAPSAPEGLEGVPADVVEWLKAAELGPFEPETFNQEALIEKAKAEGKVVVYSYSSRVFKFGKTFMEQYPGIEVEGFDIDADEIVTKIQAEQKAGSPVADVIFMSGPGLAKHELIDKGYAWNWVPPTIKDVLSEEYQQPILDHHLGMVVVIYNDQVYEAPPVHNLWDLTKPEWKGKVQFPDPTKLPEYLDFLATVVQHGDEMAATYEEVFGEPIQLSEGVENAGYEWILRLLNNDLVVTGSSNDVAKNVGAPGQSDPPIGITAYSRLRDKEKAELYFQVVTDLEPVIGTTHDAVIMVANKAPHPHAAKLMIQWMMGDEQGGQGYAPYLVPGNFPTRTDQPTPRNTKPLRELKFWRPDPDFVWDHGLEIQDFWLAHLQQ